MNFRNFNKYLDILYNLTVAHSGKISAATQDGHSLQIHVQLPL